MGQFPRKFIYKAFGLTISSEFILSELPQIDIGVGITDIAIIQVDLSRIWSEEKEKHRYFVVNEDFVMFEVPHVAIYLVRDGNKIFVTPSEGSNADQVRLYILGTCMGAILLQRRIIPLHGSAVVFDGKAHVIVGDSGAGKSTLALALLERGCQFLSDDVIPITLSSDNIPIVTPSYPQQKLWEESLNHLGIESKHFKPLVDRATKFAVPVTRQFADTPIPLTSVFQLITVNDESIGISSIKGLERLHTLFNHTYRNLFITRMGLTKWHFNTSVKIVNQLNFYQLQRPTTHFTAHELVDQVLKK